MAKLGFGNFAGRLSADELRAALAATGGNPNDLDFGEPSLPAAAEPALTPPPAAVPPPVEEESPATPTPDMSVQRASGGPQRAMRAYEDADLADMNARGDIITEAGEVQSRTHKEKAGAIGEYKQALSENKADAKSRVDAGRQHEDRMQSEADRLYDEMKAHTQPPPQSTVSKVMGIVGAVASLGGKSGLAQGASMLSSMFGADGARWAAEQEANSRLYQAALAGVQNDRSGEVNNLEVAGRMAALESLEKDAALEQIEQMGLSEKATLTARDLRLQNRIQTREGLYKIEQAKAAAAAKTRASQAEDPLWRMPLEALKQLNANGGLSEMGQKVLAQRVTNDQKDRGGEADIKKKLGEAGTGEGQEVLPGFVATVPLEKKDVSDIRANAQVLEKIKGNYQQLAEIRDRNKGNPISQWTNKDDAVLAQNIISEMTGVMNQFAGRGAPSNLELDDMKKQLLDPTDNYVLTDPKAVYRGQIERLERNFKAGLDAVGVRRVGGESEKPAEKRKYNFKPKAGSGPTTPQQLAQDYIDSREGPGRGGA